MTVALEKLLSASSAPLASGAPIVDQALRSRAGTLADELQALLARRNGFYAFESALHVFPAGETADGLDLSSWNTSTLWISGFDGLADDYLFFAEDIFGCQFAIKENVIWTFDPETGEATEIAASVAQWLQRLAEDLDTLTGYPLAHTWQTQHGALANGMRLLPKIPFVLGGEFNAANLYALDAVKGMQSRASIAVQIRDLPDGTAIRLKVAD